MKTPHQPNPLEIKSLDFITIGQKYFWLVRNVLEENIKADQAPVIVYSDQKEFEQKQKWQYSMIIIPMLFNFYHGIELTLKAFLILKHSPSTTHKLTELLEDFKKNYPDKTSLINFFEKYLTVESLPPYLKKWFQDNNLQIDKYYDFLRYPYDSKFENQVNYFSLKYDVNPDRAIKGIDLSRAMLEDLSAFLPEAAKAIDTLTPSV